LSARCCLVVPCYNEAARLDVEGFRSYLATVPTVHLLFVDDGSRDDTIGVLNRVCAGFGDRAFVLRRPANQGKAEAVRAGVVHALRGSSYEFVGFWDADLATPLNSVARFLQVFENHPGIEMVFGSRVQLLGRHVQRSAVRHYLGRVFATAVSTVLRMPIYDTQCGAKLFRVTSSTPQVFAERFISKWVFDVEIIARYLNLYRADSRLLDKAIYEYPLERWIDVAGSKVRPFDFLTAFVDVVKIKLKYLS
jgi:dolichyl-phosphate beta-glucosyltransferase